MSTSPTNTPRTDGTVSARRFPIYWLARVPPIWLLIGATLVASLYASSLVMWATSVPWLGVNLASDQNGIRVVAVAPNGPSSAVLMAGDTLVSMRDVDGGSLSLTGDSLLDNPHTYATFAAYDQFFAQHATLFGVISAGPVVFTLADGREVSVVPNARRPLHDLPLEFWAMAVLGVLVCQVGVGVWAFGRRRMPARLLAFNGACYLLLIVSFATYSTREWLLPAQSFWWLTQMSHLGGMAYGYSAMVLFWYHPRPLGRFPMASLFLLAVVLVWLNELFQIIDLPLHAFSLPYFPPFILGVWFARRQWVAARLRPDDRAALRWFLRAVLTSFTVLLVLYYLPLLFGAERMLPAFAAALLALGLFVGVVLGVLRFGLFELERWWFGMWAWFFGGLLVVATDILLVYNNLDPAGALTLSLLAVGWVYFPLRQWIWGRFVQSPSQRIETLLPELLETFFNPRDSRPLHVRWIALFSQMFDPLNVRVVAGSLPAVRPEDNGLVLAVPDIDEQRHIRLSGRTRGTRLFTQEDVQIASFTLSLARKSAQLREAQDRGAAIERERIARDLHDDVAPQLLTLAHRATTPENAERARSAMQTLRESIYALSEPRDLPLETVLAEWRFEAAERIEAANAALIWHQPAQLPEVSLTHRQHVNLARVLREAISNALRHATPSQIAITVDIRSDRFRVHLIHDGVVPLPETWYAGKGLNNMRTRIAELGGKIEWEGLSSNAGLALSWEIPLQIH